MDPMVEWEHKRRELRQYLFLVVGGVVVAIGAVVAWWFLRSGHVGDQCVTDENCVNGNTCVFDREMQGFCTVKCESDADCPDSMTCMETETITEYGRGRSFFPTTFCAPR